MDFKKNAFRSLAMILLGSTVSFTAAALQFITPNVEGLYFNFNQENMTASVYSADSSIEMADIPPVITFHEDENDPGTAYTVVAIETHAFYECGNLKTVVIPSTVTSIEYGAFEHCSALKSVTLPASLDEISESVFAFCTSLEEINLPSSIKTLNNSAFYGCSSLKSIQFPESLTTIQGGSFYFCESLTSVTLPGSLKELGDFAFYSCNSLESVVIPPSLEYMGEQVFFECPNLTKLYISDIAAWCNMERSEWEAFESPLHLYLDGNEVVKLSVPEPVSYIGGNTFNMFPYIKELTLASSVKEIGEGAFYGCNLERADLGTGLETIGSFAFAYNENLSKIYFPSSLKTINGYAFIYCESLESIELPNSITTIEEATFSASGLKSVTIPSSVKYIDQSAFSRCSELETVTLPESLEGLGAFSFEDCSKLSRVYCRATTPPYCEYYVSGGPFNYTPIYKATLYVPEGKADIYSKTYQWSGFGTIIEFGNDSVEDIISDGAESYPVAVYSLQGILIKPDAYEEDINSLPEGYYIVGGRKVRVAK